MEPTLLLGAAAALLVLAALAVLGLRRRWRDPPRAEVIFDLRLPSKWAAELTSQTLMNDGVRSHLAPSGGSWVCRVKWPMGSDRGQVEALCRRFDQIAGARGGCCVAHHITVGSETRVFEH